MRPLSPALIGSWPACPRWQPLAPGTMPRLSCAQDRFYPQVAEIFLQMHGRIICWVSRVGSAANRCLPTPINSQPVTVRGDALECAINSLSFRKLAMPSHFIRRLHDVSRASNSPLEIWNVDCDFLLRASPAGQLASWTLSRAINADLS